MPRINVRAMIKPLLPELVNPALGVEANFRLIKDYVLNTLGLPHFYRRQLALADIREVLGVKKRQDSWKYIPKKYRFSEDEYVETLDKYNRKYIHIIDVNAIDEEGNQYRQSFTIQSDFRLSKGTIERIAKDSLLENSQYYPIPITDYNIEIKALLRRVS